LEESEEEISSPKSPMSSKIKTPRKIRGNTAAGVKKAKERDSGGYCSYDEAFEKRWRPPVDTGDPNSNPLNLTLTLTLTLTITITLTLTLTRPWIQVTGSASIVDARYIMEL